MASNFTVGQYVTLTVEHRDPDGATQDTTQVTASFKQPNGVVQQAVWTEAQPSAFIEQLGEGRFRVRYPLNQVGLWKWRIDLDGPYPSRVDCNENNALHVSTSFFDR